jgi:hypothetical protein
MSVLAQSPVVLRIFMSGVKDQVYAHLSSGPPTFLDAFVAVCVWVNPQRVVEEPQQKVVLQQKVVRKRRQHDWGWRTSCQHHRICGGGSS